MLADFLCVVDQAGSCSCEEGRGLGRLLEGFGGHGVVCDGSMGVEEGGFVGDGSELIEERSDSGEEAGGSQDYYSSEEDDCYNEGTGGGGSKARQNGWRLGRE